MKFGTVGLSSLALAIASHSAPAGARQCQGDNDHGCWVDLTGTNRSIVDAVAGVACGTHPGSGGSCDYNYYLVCHRPVGSSGHTIAPCFNNLDVNSPFGPNKLSPRSCPYNPNVSDTGNHIESLVMIGPGTGTGAVQLFALGTDGVVYRSTGDSSCVTNPNPANYFTSWQQYQGFYPAGGGISFLAGVKTYPLSTQKLYGISRGTEHLYELVHYPYQHWQIVNEFTYYQLISGDHQLSIALRGSSAASKDIVLFNGAGTGLPQIPANVTLANQSGGGEGIPFYSRGYALPIATNFRSAYIVTTVNNDQNIYRSTRASISDPWSAWTVYATGDLPSSVEDDPLPWSVVDASSYRGAQGELFAIGGSYHLLNYVP